MPRRRAVGVRQLPSGRWQARTTIDGRQVTIGTYRTAADASDAIEEARSQSRDGTFVTPSDGKIAVAEWARIWLEGRMAIAPRTRDSYVTTIGALDVLGHLALAQTTPAHVRQQIAAWHAAGIKPTTIGTRLAHLRAIFQAAVDEQRIARNPARHGSIEVPRGGRSKPHRYLTYREVEAVTAELEQPYADLTWVCAWSGFRLSEALGLTTDQVDLAGGRFALDRQWSAAASSHVPLKGRQDMSEPRRTPIVEPLAATVARLVDAAGPSGFLFPSPVQAGPLADTSYRQALRDASVRAGVAPFSPHDLRHTCASWLHAVGVPLHEAAAWLGHRDASITARTYTHLWPTQMDTAASLMQRVRDMDLGGGVAPLRQAK